MFLKWIASSVKTQSMRCTCWRLCATHTSLPIKSHLWTRDACALWWTTQMAATCTPKSRIKRKLARVSKCLLTTLSLLLWRPNIGLVRVNGSGNQAHSRSKDFTQRSQNSEHIHDSEWTSKNRWFWNCPRSSTHIRLRPNCYWDTLLPQSWNLSGKTVQLKVGYLVARMHSVWDGNFKTRIWRKQYEGTCAENLEGQLPSDSKYLQ